MADLSPYRFTASHEWVRVEGSTATVGISDHAVIGDRAILTGQAGIVRGGVVPAGAVVSGMPAAPHRDFLRGASLLLRLPAILRRLEEAEKRLEAIGKGGGPWSSESSKS